ncbi:MAG: hypothetical protein ACTTJZ_02530 [Sphaerochaetaceae bacterium]
MDRKQRSRMIQDMSRKGHYYLFYEDGEVNMGWVSNKYLEAAGETIEELREAAARVDRYARVVWEKERAFFPGGTKEQAADYSSNEIDEESVRIAEDYFESRCRKEKEKMLPVSSA